MIRAIVAAGLLLLLATGCSKVTYVTPEAATEQARGDGTAVVEDPTTTPDATPEPTDEPDARIRPGVWVRVDGAGDCLNFRAQPSADDERVATNYCRPDGTEGYVAAGPQENDDGRWWFIAGLGWAVDDFLVFDRLEDLSERVVPELEGLGRIAFVDTDGDLWTMNSDGSDRERVEPLVRLDADPSEIPSVSLPSWNPDGSAAIVHTAVGLSGDRRFDVYIVDRFGNTIYEFENAASASWSPEGRRIALLQDLERNELGSSDATPVVIDLVDGAVTAIGPKQVYAGGPQWRPNGRELIYEDIDGVHLVQADGSDDRPLPVEGRSATWSPDGTLVTMWVPMDLCGGYAAYNVDRDDVELCVEIPEFDSRHEAQVESEDDGQTDWSPDSRFFAYHTEWAVQNQSGVYVVDVETGEQTLLPGWQAAFTSFSPDGRYVFFSTGGGPAPSFIWSGEIETGDVILLAEGSAPSFVAER